jgi:hypothetical protein
MIRRNKAKRLRRDGEEALYGLFIISHVTITDARRAIIARSPLSLHAAITQSTLREDIVYGAAC